MRGKEVVGGQVSEKGEDSQNELQSSFSLPAEEQCEWADVHVCLWSGKGTCLGLRGSKALYTVDRRPERVKQLCLMGERLRTGGGWAAGILLLTAWWTS